MKLLKYLPQAIMVALAVVACGAQQTAPNSVFGQPFQRTTTSGLQLKPGQCHVRGSGLLVEPDLSCTPGATDPAVTSADVKSTICDSAWYRQAEAKRPPVTVTEGWKRDLLTAYGLPEPMGAYELDHLVPLELGGAAADERNVWPESNYPSGDAHITKDVHNPKDAVEYAARQAVCHGTMSLPDAQKGMEGDWVALGKSLQVKDVLDAEAKR